MPKSWIGWLVCAAASAALLFSGYCLSRVALAWFGIARLPRFLYLDSSTYWSMAGVTLAIGLYLAFARSLRE